MNDLSSMINGGENGGEEAESFEHMSIHEHDLSQGGEFLDDGIRMTEQPLRMGNPFLMPKYD